MDRLEIISEGWNNTVPQSLRAIQLPRNHTNIYKYWHTCSFK